LCNVIGANGRFGVTWCQQSQGTKKELFSFSVSPGFEFQPETERDFWLPPSETKL